MKLLLIAIGVFVVAATATAATPPTSAQAQAAIFRQADDFYVDTVEYEEQVRDLASVRCRSKNKSAFICTATGYRSHQHPMFTIRLLVKSRKAGGFCWAIMPAPVPSGCLAPGKRAVGEVNDVGNAVWSQAFSDGSSTLVDFAATPHGSGFYSWRWREVDVWHRGTVVFSPTPKVKVLA